MFCVDDRDVLSGRERGADDRDILGGRDLNSDVLSR